MLQQEIPESNNTKSASQHFFIGVVRSSQLYMIQYDSMTNANDYVALVEHLYVCDADRSLVMSLETEKHAINNCQQAAEMEMPCIKL